MYTSLAIIIILVITCICHANFMFYSDLMYTLIYYQYHTRYIPPFTYIIASESIRSKGKIIGFQSIKK